VLATLSRWRPRVQIPSGPHMNEPGPHPSRMRASLMPPPTTRTPATPTRRRPRPRRSRNRAQQIPSGPHANKPGPHPSRMRALLMSTLVVGTRGAAAIGCSKSRQDRSSHESPGLRSRALACAVTWVSAPATRPRDSQPRARAPHGAPRRLDAVTFPRYPETRARCPQGSLEVGYGGFGQARDAGVAPCASVGRFLLPPSDSALSDLPSAPAAGTGRPSVRLRRPGGGRHGRKPFHGMTIRMTIRMTIAFSAQRTETTSSPACDGCHRMSF